MYGVLLTGGPGGGKTTLLNGLRKRGYDVIDESARSIIAERQAQGLSPRPDPLEFAREVLGRDIEKYACRIRASRVTFFDRGIIDALGMLDEVAPIDPGQLQVLLAKYPYHRQVLVFPPWQAIYRTDAERDQTFAEARQIHDRVTTWYRRCGYELVDVPPMRVGERLNFVLQALNLGNA